MNFSKAKIVSYAITIISQCGPEKELNGHQKFSFMESFRNLLQILVPKCQFKKLKTTFNGLF